MAELDAGREPSPLRLAELASALGCELLAGGDAIVSGVASLDSAGPGDLSFARSARYASALAASRAGAVIVAPGLDAGSRPSLRSLDPTRDFARAAAMLVAAARPSAGVHPLAIVDASAQVDATASIGAAAVVAARTRVGARSVVHPGVVLYADVEIGADCEVHAGVVVRERTRIGDRVRIQPGARIGGDGFGFLPREDGLPERIPQLGRVVIDDDVDIGAGTSIARATLGETRIGRGAKIDDLVMIGHNCEIGEGAIVVAQTGLGGSTRVGARAILMARVGSAGQLEIGDGAFVGARAGLHRDVAPGARVFGSPAVPERAWHRELGALRLLPAALRRLRAVERALGLRSRQRERASEDES